MFKLYYGFNTWVVCLDDGDLYANCGSGVEGETLADNIVLGWSQGI